MSRMVHGVWGVVVLLALATSAHAQVDRATLTGIVRDPSDAVIATAQVKVTSLATNVVTTVSTTIDGMYLVVNLAPGEYLVQVEAPGFQRFEQTVSLSIGARARLDLSLPVGSVGETVTVEGVTPLLSSESAVLGTVVSNVEVSTLPLAIRNWDDLLAMVPGVQSDRYTEQAGGTSAGRTGGVSVHGNRSLQNNFLLDGVANNSFSTNVQELTTQISRPSVDAIDEFKVVTSPYAAEYGYSPGAAIIVNTKSGTNTMRGTVYDFYRDDGFDTINYFAKAANQQKSTNNQNQFGGNLGGPILRDRAFFFGDYEGTRIEQGVLRTGNVMTQDQRRGVFTSTIRDPQTGQPFPNNTIPDSRIDPVARSIMDAGAVAEHHRLEQLHPPAKRRGRIGSLSRACRLPSRQQRHDLCSLHLFRPVPVRAGLVWRRPRRDLDVSLGPQLPQISCGGRWLDESARLQSGQRVALFLRARHQRRHAGSVW